MYHTTDLLLGCLVIRASDLRCHSMVTSSIPGRCG